jgi:hypothetical protein
MTIIDDLAAAGIDVPDATLYLRYIDKPRPWNAGRHSYCDAAIAALARIAIEYKGQRDADRHYLNEALIARNQARGRYAKAESDRDMAQEELVLAYHDKDAAEQRLMQAEAELDAERSFDGVMLKLDTYYPLEVPYFANSDDPGCVAMRAARQLLLAVAERDAANHSRELLQADVNARIIERDHARDLVVALFPRITEALRVLDAAPIDQKASPDIWWAILKARRVLEGEEAQP